MKKNNQKFNDSTLSKRLLGYGLKHWGAFLAVMIMMIITTIIGLLSPLIMGKVMKLLEDASLEFVQVIYWVILLSIVVFASVILEVILSYILQKTGQKIIYEVRENVFTAIESYSIAQMKEIPAGKLVTRVTTDTNTLNEMYTSVIINVLKNALTIIGVIGAMFFVSPKLTLYILLFTPVLVIVSVVFRKYSRRAYREVRKNVSNVNSFVSENINGMKVTKVFGQEEKKYKEFQVENTNLMKSSLKEILAFAIFRPSIYVIYISAVIMVFWVGGNESIQNNIIITTGFTYIQLTIFYQYIDKLFTPLQQLAEQFNILQSSLASAERIFEAIDKKSDIIEEVEAIELTDVKGKIEFKNVWFSYIPDEWILQDVSFSVEPNETVAFVGATGSGKSTILSLITRNYDIQKGSIYIDGIDITKVKVASLRKAVGQMLQDVFLFSGTIASNISLRDEEITDEEIIKAANYVNADSFIDKLPNGYQEEVKEKGANFSSGQRQLLSFARTIVHTPKILILDEATANIDTETENLIQDSLKKLMSIGTMLIVAHRLSTIQHADKIIVIEAGKIIEEGTHQRLLKNKGHYYKLYKLQYDDSDNHSVQNIIV